MHRSNDVRRVALQKYIDPARSRGDLTVRVNAGEIHRELHLTNRVPLVCAALRAEIFLKANNLTLLKTEGPPSGQSTTVTYTYALGPAPERSEKPRHPLWKMRGIAKASFSALGGGEAFLRKEREKFLGDSQ